MQHLGRRQSGLDHQFHFPMLEEARKAGGRAGVRAEAEPYAFISQFLEILLGHFEETGVAVEVRVLAQLSLILRIAQSADHVGRQAPGEKGILEELTRPGEFEQGRLAGQRGGGLPGPVLLHGGNQFLVHGLVTDAVGQAAQAFADQGLGVVQVEDVCGHFQVGLVGVGDDIPAKIQRDLLLFAQVIVHPDLDHIHPPVGELIDVLLDFGRVGHLKRYAFHAWDGGGIAAHAGEAAAGGEDPGIGGTPGALLLPDLEDQGLIRAHADHGGDAVGGVQLEILLYALARVKLGVLHEAHGISQVSMEIDDAGHHVLAGEVHGLGAGGRLQFCGRAHPLDAAILNDDGGVGERGPAGAVDQREMTQNGGLSERGGGSGECDGKE